MSPTLTTFLFEAANFLVLAGVLSWLFFQPIRQALDDRRARLEAEDRQAAQKLAEAARAEQQIDAARSNLQQELNELRSRELEAARRQADRLLAEARTSADRQLESARRQAVRLSETQQDTLAQVAAAAAAEAVGKLLQQIAGTDLHAALIQSACRRLETMPREAIAPVKIETDQPLAAEQRAALETALGPAATAADFRTVENMGVGVRISTGRGLIDASVGGLTNFARQSLLKEMNHRSNNHNPLQFANHG